MPNSLDPDQARHLVVPDLGQNCLQRLSADDTSWQRVEDLIMFFKANICYDKSLMFKLDHDVKQRL